MTDVSPSSRARGVVHNLVQITGTGFVAGSTVTFPGGGVTVNSTTVVDSAHLTADVSITAAAALGVRDARVTRPGAPTTTSTCAGCFTVDPKPAVTSVSPAQRPQGAVSQDLVVTGTDLAPDAVVTFGSGIVVNAVSGGGTSLVVNVSVSPSAALGARAVTATNSDGGAATKNNAFTVTAQPTATALVPGAVPQGKTVNVQITGSGFPANFTTAGGLVSFGPSITVNTVTRNSATKLTANVTIGIAATLGTRDVTVTNPDGGAATCGGCFTVNEMPAITSVIPASGGQGVVHRAITVTGTGFQTGVTASIAGGGVTVNSVTRNDSTSLTLDVTVANAAATGARNLVVTNPDTGAVTCLGCFAVGLRPTISGTAPNSRAAGGSYSISVNGASFQSGAAVTFSGSGIQVNSVTGSGSSLSVGITIAFNATIGNRDVSVTNPDGGSAIKTNGFKVLVATTTTTAPRASTTTSIPVG